MSLYSELLFCRLKCRINTRDINASGLSHVWTTAAATSHQAGNIFDKSTGTKACGHCRIRCSREKSNFFIGRYGCDNARHGMSV